MPLSSPSAASSKAPAPATILLTIDVEDWFQVENLRPWFPPARWDAPALRVEANTHRLLDLFDSFTHPVKATFFILGWIAERCPQLVREIHHRGHEVASHGHGHQLCNQLAAPSLLADLQQSKQLLEQIIGQPIHGYRAPNFSIRDDVLKIIRQCGYRYDASYNSFEMHNRYGHITHQHFKKAGIALALDTAFYELPISNLRLAGQTIPWGGGGYFRLLPPPLFNAGVRAILHQTHAYHFYMHPWEVDSDQPKVKEANGFNGWRHYLNLRKTLPRLQRMITEFKHCRFLTCRQYLDTVTHPDNPNPPGRP